MKGCRPQRNRYLYSSFIAITVLLGLLSRQYRALLPSWLAAYSGDALWALMVFFILGLLFKTKSTFFNAAVALAFSFAIEISQLYHAPWIDGIRSTRLGGLVLGFGFLWSDLVCYTVGTLVGVLLELAIFEFIIKRKTV